MSEKKSGGTSKQTLQTQRIEIPTKISLTHSNALYRFNYNDNLIKCYHNLLNYVILSSKVYTNLDLMMFYKP
ncbi:MAG: hypothetical protein F6K58_23685 [Symploca sp. SIO2E9]|nr:hypothetical protein [Symploca sp. SIO2E9]